MDSVQPSTSEVKVDDADLIKSETSKHGGGSETEIDSSTDGNKNEKGTPAVDTDETGTHGDLEKDKIKYLPLYKAALNGDWDAAEKLFNDNQFLPTDKLSFSKNKTVLHVAVSTGRCNKFVQKLVDLLPPESLRLTDSSGSSPLHNAAVAGNTEAARILVTKDQTLTQQRNNHGRTALHRAAQYGHKETTSYLLSVTRDEDPSPFSGKEGVRLVNYLITAEFYDIALHLVKCYPRLACEEDSNRDTALETFSQKPQAFLSGSHLASWQRFFYHFFVGMVDRHNAPLGTEDLENPGGCSEKYRNNTKQYRFLEQFEKTMLKYKQSMDLLRFLISEAIKLSESEVDMLLGRPARLAATLGIHEFVIEIIKAYPEAVWIKDRNGRNIFHLAALHHQEKVFNLIYQISSYKHFVMALEDKFGNNMLHLAAKLAPSNIISGAALQMQRELQWFQQVENMVQPAYKESKNKDGKTPKMVFSEEHRPLVDQGEKWMKETAESYSLVAALIVTVVFAAAFTVPGGNHQEHGIPIFLNDASFMIFAISNTVALFSSATSLLMFLSILTSRYSEKDFLKALPMRLSIGLITLFFSIASMLVAFSSTIHILLSHKVKRIAIPIGLLACVPVTLFAFLQFPLLVEVVFSTFGPSIFHKQSDEIIM